jgi:hypothetical protein
MQLTSKIVRLDQAPPGATRRRPETNALPAALPAGCVQLFAREGFLAIDSLTTPDDVALIRSLLDPLFDRFESLGERAVDLAGPRESGVAPRSPEINEPTTLAPGLRKTLAYVRCRAIARQILGVPVGYMFDHAIYKPPHNNTPTAWHQDEAYSRRAIPLRSVHFWIPLQDVTEQNGCMCFIPGSNLTGLRPHHAASSRHGGRSSTTVGATLATQHVDHARLQACPLVVGGATAHHPLTLHYTGANQSDNYRRAWIVHFGAYGRMRFLLHPRMAAARLRALLGRI